MATKAMTQRELVANALANRYENGEKVPIISVPAGSLVISKTVEKLGEDTEVWYQIMVPYMIGKTIVRAGTFDEEGLPIMNLTFKPNELVVLL